MNKLSFCLLLILSMCCSVFTLQAKKNGIIGQYYAIFNDNWMGSSTDGFHKALKMNPPFNEWDITFIAFAHTHLNAENKPYLGYENNKRMIDGKLTYPNPNDAKADNDENRIKELISAVGKVNPKMKFIISLGYGGGDSNFTKDRQKVENDIGGAMKDPDHFADSVVKFLKENNLDGFDIDYEAGSTLSKSDFKKMINKLREKFDIETTISGKKYFLTITADTTEGFDSDTINEKVDYVGAQGYNGGGRVKYPKMENIILEAGVKPELMLIGMNIEYSDDEASTERIEYMKKNKCGGIFGWRVNCGSQMENDFSGVKKMYKIMNE